MSDPLLQTGARARQKLARRGAVLEKQPRRHRSALGAALSRSTGRNRRTQHSRSAQANTCRIPGAGTKVPKRMNRPAYRPHRPLPANSLWIRGLAPSRCTSITPNAHERPVPPPAAPPSSVVPSCKRKSACIPMKRPEPPWFGQRRSGPTLQSLPQRGCGGDETGPGGWGAISRCRSEDSARTPRRAIAREGARPHSESRRERRRHVVKRSAAIAADFLWRILHAQPVSARGTFRSQTLHRPSGQILHPVPRSPSTDGWNGNAPKPAGLCGRGV